MMIALEILWNLLLFSTWWTEWHGGWLPKHMWPTGQLLTVAETITTIHTVIGSPVFASFHVVSKHENSIFFGQANIAIGDSRNYRSGDSNSTITIDGWTWWESACIKRGTNSMGFCCTIMFSSPMMRRYSVAIEWNAFKTFLKNWMDWK